MNLLLTCLEYVQRFLKIIDKRGQLIPFRLNQPQRRLYEAIKGQERGCNQSSEHNP